MCKFVPCMNKNIFIRKPLLRAYSLLKLFSRCDSLLYLLRRITACYEILRSSLPMAAFQFLKNLYITRWCVRESGNMKVKRALICSRSSGVIGFNRILLKPACYHFIDRFSNWVMISNGLDKLRTRLYSWKAQCQTFSLIRRQLGKTSKTNALPSLPLLLKASMLTTRSRWYSCHRIFVVQLTC